MSDGKSHNQGIKKNLEGFIEQRDVVPVCPTKTALLQLQGKIIVTT